jgi:type VI protein secretion system component VasK
MCGLSTTEWSNECEGGTIEMPIWAWILIAAAIVVGAVLVYGVLTRRRTARLRERFGPEYDRTVEQRGERRQAEAELQGREERRERLEIRPLTPEAHERYLESWRRLQSDFVDDPAGAVNGADQLVSSVMSERGYPMDDFEQRAEDISVDHPEVVERYRSAHGIAIKNDEGEATTEDLRQALKHYRALFEELLEPEAEQSREREATETTDTTREEHARQR